MKSALLLLTALLLGAPARGHEELGPKQVAVLLGEMHEVNLLETRVGTMARTKATTPELRRFGTLIWRDHRTADEDVVFLSHHYGFAYAPPAPAAQVEDDERTLRELGTAQGAAFDRLFLDSTAAVASDAARTLRAAEPHVAQKDVRRWMDHFAPILDQHVAIANELRGQP